jgi:hypothetical protein
MRQMQGETSTSSGAAAMEEGSRARGAALHASADRDAQLGALACVLVTVLWVVAVAYAVWASL